MRSTSTGINRRTYSSERRVEEWALPVSKPDNHLFDVLVGNAVAASMVGVTPAGTDRGETPKPQQQTADFAELQRQAREMRP